MGKKIWAFFIMGFLCVSFLVSCGDDTELELLPENSENVESEEPVEQVTGGSGEQGDHLAADPGAEPVKVELMAEDYIEMANQYKEEGYIKEQRDALELCWVLFGDVRAFQQLDSIVVNVAEETADIQDMAELLWNNLDIPEYHNEAVATVYSQDWITVMMPTLKEGARTYYLDYPDIDGMMVWKTGYNSENLPYANVWYRKKGQVIFLKETPEEAQMISTGWENGHYQGDFESWLCYASNGDVYHEEGEFQEGKLNGAYTVQIHEGTEPVDLFSLWQSREDLKKTEYKGEFNTDGTIAVKQPEEKVRQDEEGTQEGKKQLVYAYTKNENSYLFLNVPEDATVESTVFSYEMTGLSSYPEVVTYHPLPQKPEILEEFGDTLIKAADVKVRVFNSDLQWFDGTKWHTLGTVEEFINNDPVKAYAGRQQEVPEKEENTSEPDRVLTNNGGTGSIKKETKPKPSTPPSEAPSTPPSEAPSTPPPEAPSTPPPSEAPNDPLPSETPSTPPDDGSNASSSETPSTPQGNDVDVEWTPDDY